ncbi:hypothetical protein WH52_05100 [Tenacibaculum holothuriorum]|uniref:Uncharacterized protein n=1 Tax=Tenacibaculum holothuriorum TaxID=1635173 RepID=A0A1Y2PH50_9FLAO|nr:hypothetical protein [Tenacibaculum holothuriorum]OSY89039.1 hypothetical protein WH52_05100 [Tenacibaculum holothuriorum]
MRKKQIIFIGIIIISLILNSSIDSVVMKGLLEKLIFNSVSILVGLSIALSGIFLSSINTVYLSIYRMTKTKKKKESFSDEEIQMIKSKLTELVDELRENSMFSLYSFLSVITLFFIKEIDFPYIQWFIESEIITKIFVFDSIILIGNFLIFWSIIDSMEVVFKISKAFELVREE